MNARAAILAVSLPLVWACASTGSGTASAGPRHDPNRISAEELQGVSVSNLYEAIRLLRPQWFSARNPTAFRPQGETSLVVYMDRIRFGDPEMLRQFPPTMPLAVRYLSPSEAEGEFGAGHLQGAIQVVTRQGR